MTVDALTVAVMATLAVGFLTQPVVLGTMIAHAVSDRPGDR